MNDFSQNGNAPGTVPFVIRVVNIPKPTGLREAIATCLDVMNEDHELLAPADYAFLETLRSGADPRDLGRALGMLHQTLGDIAFCSGTSHPNWRDYDRHLAATLTFRRDARDLLIDTEAAGILTLENALALQSTTGAFMDSLAQFSRTLDLRAVPLEGVESLEEERRIFSKLEHSKTKLECAVAEGFATLGVNHSMLPSETGRAR